MLLAAQPPLAVRPSGGIKAHIRSRWSVAPMTVNRMNNPVSDASLGPSRSLHIALHAIDVHERCSAPGFLEPPPPDVRHRLESSHRDRPPVHREGGFATIRLRSISLGLRLEWLNSRAPGPPGRAGLAMGTKARGRMRSCAPARDFAARASVPSAGPAAAPPESGSVAAFPSKAGARRHAPGARGTRKFHPRRPVPHHGRAT